MSYPKNAATPKPILVGAVTLIADGSNVTSDASVAVKLDTAGAGAGGGTLAYDAALLGWTYAPTQAETNGDVLMITVYKASCLSAEITVIIDRTDVITDKVGFKLASDGLDAVATTAPTGPASNFREMLVQVWRRFFKKATLTATQEKTYADNGSTVVTTQAVSDDGTTQTQGDAS